MSYTINAIIPILPISSAYKSLKWFISMLNFKFSLQTLIFEIHFSKTPFFKFNSLEFNSRNIFQILILNLIFQDSKF